MRKRHFLPMEIYHEFKHSAIGLHEVIMVNPSHKSSAINESYVQDNEYSIQVNRLFLKPIGAWSTLNSTSKTERTVGLFINFTCYLLITLTVIPSTLFILLEDTNIHERLKALGPMSHWLMGGLNYSFLLLKRKKIANCIEHIKTDWRRVKRTQDRRLMLKNAKLGRFIACISAFCMHLGVSSHCVTCIATKIVVPIGNETVVMHPLPCPIYTKLVDTRYSPMNEIFLTIESMAGFIVNSVTVGACGLAAVFAMHACGQLGVVMSWLDDLVNETGKDMQFAEERLADIVRLHLRALSFVSCIEEIMNQICFVELVGCTLNLCMLGYYSIMEWDKEKRNSAMFGVIFCAMTFNVFIFCYIGENISEQSKEVGKRAYLSNWYHLHHKTSLGLVLIILRSNCVVKITAGKMIETSIATFADVIKTAFAYLNILRRVAM